ncbi:MAG: hypothetical protein LBT79_07945 [Elusimicrobiota bacterium]|jgi:hypothetical protein|nr:hypothetical protein [Elusimicrobiota bacterium]
MIDLGKIIDNPLSNKIGALAEFGNFATSVAKTIFVKPNIDKGITGIGADDFTDGFIFDVKGEESVDFESDITDHYIESNSPLQDHIALKPIIVNVKGFVGEVKSATPKALAGIAGYVGKLQALTPFAPQLTAQAQAIYNEVERNYRIYEEANKTAKSIWGDFKDQTDGLNVPYQSRVFNFFKKCWATRMLFIIQTQWTIFENMTIKNLKSEQGEETKYITDFSIIFKQINFAQDITTKPTAKSGRATQQSQSQADKGIQSPKKQTLAFKSLSSFMGK